MTEKNHSPANDSFPLFSDQEMHDRHRRVRAEMQQRGLDALIVYGCMAIGTSEGQVNLQYLSRYAAVVETYLVFPAEGEPTLMLFVPFHRPNALAISVIKDIRVGNTLQNVVSRVKELNLERSRIGLVGPGAAAGSGISLFVEQRQFLDENLPGVQFENATVWFDDVRLIKSDEELALLRKAGALTDLAHEEVFQLTQPGVTHRELRRAVNSLAMRHGATYPFGHISSISMRDPSDYYPDFYPTATNVVEGELVMTEFALGYGNYWGKLWGTYFVGEPTDEYRRLFEVAATVHDNLVEQIRVGMTGRQVNQFLQPIIDAGFEQPANILVGGWSAMNHAPTMGAMPSSLSFARTDRFLNETLKPRQALTLHAWVNIPDTSKGLWIGSSGAMGEERFESFNRYPISELRVIPA